MSPKSLLINSLLISASLLIALLACEVVVRVLSLSPEVVYIAKWRVRLAENPKIAYEPIPNIDSSDKEVRFYGYDGMSNNMGYRDYDHSLNKASGSKRILIIGDSVAQGLWINDDTKIYSSVMETQLRKLGHQVDVMNFGVSGYNTQQEVETLIDKGLQFKPDLVILGYCLNDKFQDDGGIYGMLLADREKSKGEGAIVNRTELSPLVKYSDFLRFLKYVVLRDASAESAKEEGAKESQSLQQNVAELYNQKNVEKYFAILGELSKQHNFDTRVFIFPDFGKGDEALTGGWDNYAYANEHTSISALAKNSGLEVFDLYGSFQECHNELGHNVSYDRYHPNPQGSECAGKKMAAYLSGEWF